MKLSFLILIFFYLISCNTVKDIDGNRYKKIQIGNQVWLKQNLKVTRYNNGDIIETYKPDTGEINKFKAPKFQFAYNGDEENVKTYGRLYTWYVVNDPRKVCPAGWHVPSDDEFCILENYLEPGIDSTCTKNEHRGKEIGLYLKEAGNKHWKDNEGANNKSGFTVLPAGIRYRDGEFRNYLGYGYFWTTTVFTDTAFARTRRLYHNTGDISRSRYHKKDALSVRCIKNK